MNDDDDKPPQPRTARSIKTRYYVLGVLFVIMGLRTARLDRLPDFDVSLHDGSSSSWAAAADFFSTHHDQWDDWISEEESPTAADNAAPRKTLDELMNVASADSNNNHNNNHTCPSPETHYIPTGRRRDRTSPNQPSSVMVIHQMDMNNCLRDDMYQKSTILWHSIADNHSSAAAFDYCYHTNETAQALLHQDWPEFPHLRSIVSSCVPYFQGWHDIWKALVLWEFGGVAVDLGVAPDANANHEGLLKMLQSIQEGKNDAILFAQGPWIKPDLVAMKPKHPIAYYWVLHALHHIQNQQQLVHQDWSQLTGYASLEGALWYFTGVDLGAKNRPANGFARNKLYRGRYNQTAFLADFDQYCTLAMGNNWRGKHYTLVHKMEDAQRWNQTCLRLTREALFDDDADA